MARDMGDRKDPMIQLTKESMAVCAASRMLTKSSAALLEESREALASSRAMIARSDRLVRAVR